MEDSLDADLSYGDIESYAHALGLDVSLFYDAVNEGELHMHHVFPIAHPEWPQSQKAIQLISDNATRRL